MNPKTDPALERWLSTATEGLPPEMAADVQIELAAHYEDAVGDYLVSGRTPDAARAAALGDLGDARAVHRMLHRVHLSRGERVYHWLNWLAPRLWQHRAILITGLFGLLALTFVVGDHRHWISYRGHLDPLTPLSLVFVIASLVLERKLAIWSYPAVGYLLTGVWPWLFVVVEKRLADVSYSAVGHLLARTWPWLFFEFLDSLGGFWSTLAPLLLPAATLIVLAVLGLRQLRHARRRGSPLIAGLLICLTVAAEFAMTTVQLVDRDVVFRPAALSPSELAANTPWALYVATMLLAPVAIGLLAARRDGIAAALIPLACHYSLLIDIADPTYRLTFHDGYWQPVRSLHLIEALLTYLPALITFLIAPLWMLRSRSKAGESAAALVSMAFVLLATHGLSALGLQQTPEVYTAATWVSSVLETLIFTLPIVLAVVVYGRFPPRAMQTFELLPEEQVASSSEELKGLLTS